MATEEDAIERLAKDYCSVLGNSVVISSGSINDKVITLFKNVRDIDQDSSKTYMESFLYHNNSLLSIGAPVEVVKMACYDVSLSGQTIS